MIGLLPYHCNKHGFYKLFGTTFGKNDFSLRMPEISCDLNSCFLCSHCIPEWKQVIAHHKKTIQYPKGKTVFREGDPVKGIYFVYHGVVKVTMPWGADKELILRFARAGDILGHRGFGTEAVYPISGITVTPAKICFIENDFMEATLKINNDFSNQLVHVYASELHQAEKRMRDLAHRDVKGRISMVLLELIDKFGMDAQQNISLPLRRQDIASFA